MGDGRGDSDGREADDRECTEHGCDLNTRILRTPPHCASASQPTEVWYLRCLE